MLFRQLGVGTIIHPEMLASLCAVFPSVGFFVCRLPFRQVLVCLRYVSVGVGLSSIHRCWLPCVTPVGFVVNTVVTSGGSTIL